MGVAARLPGALMQYQRSRTGLLRLGTLGIASMRAFIPFFACLVPHMAFAAEEDAILQTAFRIIAQRRLLSRAELSYPTLILEEATKMVATVTVRQKHDGKCGGALETAPRRFTIEIDLKTGASRWDNNDEMETNPIPQ